MKDRTALGEAILKHWREHNPQMVRDLTRSKGLDQAVFAAQERAGDLLHELTVVQKMDHQSAWEMAMQEWASPTHETDQPSGSTTSASRTSNRKRRPRPRGTSG